MLSDFVIRALAAGLLVALLTGALGVFVVWRRMAYFGDTISHASLLGVSLGLLLGMNVNISIIAVSLLVALSMVWLQTRRSLGNDTLLGILAHGSLALGLVALAFAEGGSVDLNAWLFGDILAVSWQDVGVFAGVTLVVLLTLLLIWKPLLSLTVHEDLARVEGVQVTLVSAVYTLLIALTIAAGMRVIGALLISSMLIIPAATARKLSSTPLEMTILSTLAGCLAVILGFVFSYWLDTPTGPSIVMAAVLLFIIVQSVPLARPGQK